MSREIDREPPQDPRSNDPGQRGDSLPSRGAGASSPATPGPSREPGNHLPDTRLPARERAYYLTPEDRATLNDIGRFRTLTTSDLAEYRWAGDDKKLSDQLGSLSSQGLIQQKTIWAGKRQGRVELVALTREARELLEAQSNDATRGTPQVFYDRFVKPAEILHDAAIYRMYQAEAERIGRAGGQITRVVLDYELKRKAYSPLAKARALPPAEYERRQQQIAQEHGLKVVRGHIVLPDLRIEYETSDGDQARVDLELATEHYRGSDLATKAEAGFTMYAPGASAGRLTKVLEQREITAEILSL